MTTASEIHEIQWAGLDQMEVPRDELQMQIEIYKESILIRKMNQSAVKVMMISADDIADTLAQHTKYESGMLPTDTLWWKKSHTVLITALWKPPQVWAMALQTEPFKPPTRLNLPMPGLVFLCSPNRSPWVFAAKKKPEGPNEILFKTPTFNVFRDGRVCPGNHEFPSQPEEVPKSFFQSFFSRTGDSHNRSQKHPTDLQELWQEIDGKEEYPLEDLLPQCTVADAMGLPESNTTRSAGWPGQ